MPHNDTLCALDNDDCLVGLCDYGHGPTAQALPAVRSSLEKHSELKEMCERLRWRSHTRMLPMDAAQMHSSALNMRPIS